MWHAINSASRPLSVLALFTLLPGLSTFFWAHHRVTSELEPARSLNVNGIRIPQAVIDIGTVWSGGQNVQRNFTLENLSGHAVGIESVTSDCGCTVASASSNEIAPGQSTNIPVLFWPPTVANDRAGAFRRRITVVIKTFEGTQSIVLLLTGFVEPDGALRVFPVNVDLDSPAGAEGSSTILHFKGAARLLASIPVKLLVTPGQNQRVLLPNSQVGAADDIETKDVQIQLTNSSNTSELKDWNSKVVFTPDSQSDGLTIHIRGHVSQFAVVSPKSVILADDSDAEATVRLTIRSGISLISESVASSLPLELDFLPDSSARGNSRTLRIRVKGPLNEDMAGSINLQLKTLSQIETISVPVVILRHSHVSSTAFEKP